MYLALHFPHSYQQFLLLVRITLSPLAVTVPSPYQVSFSYVRISSFSPITHLPRYYLLLDRLTPRRRFRAVFLALVLTATAVWLFNSTCHWQLPVSRHSSSGDLSDPVAIVQSVTEPLGTIETHAHLDIVNSTNDTNGPGAADLQLQRSAAIERLLPASAADSWMVPNREALGDLLSCLESDGCRPNQRKSMLHHTATFLFLLADRFSRTP